MRPMRLWPKKEVWQPAARRQRAARTRRIHFGRGSQKFKCERASKSKRVRIVAGSGLSKESPEIRRRKAQIAAETDMRPNPWLWLSTSDALRSVRATQCTMHMSFAGSTSFCTPRPEGPLVDVRYGRRAVQVGMRGAPASAHGRACNARTTEKFS